MRWFRRGFAALAGLYLLLVYLFVGVADTVEWLNHALRPLLWVMQPPVAWVYPLFHLHDDDARIIYPILISAAIWGLIGGTAAALAAAARRATARRRPPG